MPRMTGGRLPLPLPNYPFPNVLSEPLQRVASLEQLQHARALNLLQAARTAPPPLAAELARRAALDACTWQVRGQHPHYQAPNPMHTKVDHVLDPALSLRLGRGPLMLLVWLELSCQLSRANAIPGSFLPKGRWTDPCP